MHWASALQWVPGSRQVIYAELTLGCESHSTRALLASGAEGGGGAFIRAWPWKAHPIPRSALGGGPRTTGRSWSGVLQGGEQTLGRSLCVVTPSPNRLFFKSRVSLFLPPSFAVHEPIPGWEGGVCTCNPADTSQVGFPEGGGSTLLPSLFTFRRVG